MDVTSWLWKAQGWLEQMRQLKETEDQVSAAKRNILQAVTLALEEHGVQEEKREGVDEAGAETLLGTFTYDVNKMIAQTFHVQKQLPRTFRYIKFQVESNWGNPEYTCVYRVQDESGLSEAELESLRKAQGWLEQMRQLKETEDQVSAAKRNILQAVTLALEEHGVQEEKREGVDEAGAETLLGTFTYDVNKMIAQTFHVQKQLPRTFRYIKFQVESNWGNPEYTCVYRVQDESGLSEAELESLRKAQGWLEQMRQLKETEDQVSAAKRNILQAVTLALEEHGVQEEKREGVDEAGAETLLGTFTYDVNKMIAQTFHVQKQLPRTFRYIKFQVESNWGNPEYTCVYRVQDESGLSEAELESLRKAQGWLEQMRQLKETEDQVSAAKRNILQAVTLALEEHGVQEEKREGVDEAGAETLLGTFTYDVNKMIAQTFHVQKQLPRTFRYIKFQVESNWGNPEYTCVYRVQKAGSCMDLASPHSNHSMVQTGNLHHSSELFDAFWYFKFQVERDRGNPEYTCVYRVQEYRKRDESGLSEAELESLRKAQGWLEQMRQLKETEDQVSAAKRNILQAVTLALEEHGVQEEKREGVDEAGAETLLGTFTYDVNKMIAQTFHVQKQLPRTFRYIKFQVESNWGNPEYTCVYRVQKAGSCVDLASPHSNHSMVQTGNLHHSSELFDAFWYFKFQVERDRGNPEYTCVYRVQEYRKRDESGLSEAELESLRKAQGWLEQMRQLKETEDQVPAAKRNILQAVTLALEEHGVQEEKREGVDEAGAETLLGTFTYDVNKMIAQTFHVQKQLPRTFRYIKFQVESNWGNPEYTCVYRVQKAGSCMDLASPHSNHSMVQTGNLHHSSELFDAFWYFKFQVERDRGNPEYTCVYRVQEYRKRDESGLSEAELESLRKAQGWLEQMRQLKETEDQVSAAKRNILQAVTLALEEHGVQEEKREGVDEAGAETLLGTFTYDVNKMIAQTFHVQKQLPRTFRYIKFQVESNWGNPEYTCVYRVQKAGSCMDLASPHSNHSMVQTGNLHHSSELFDAFWYFKFQVERDRGNPEYTCVYRVQEYRKRDESGLSEAELESLRKAQGWLEQMRQLKETEDQVSAAKRNILQAVTLALEEHGVQEEKREGVDEAGAETLLGTFTYDVNKMIAQTFHVQKQLPRTFRYIKFQVESNWGNPEYTCVYRVQDESGLSEAELESLRKAQGWLEQMRQLKETEDQVSAAKRNILQAVTLALEEHGVQEEKREGVDEAGAETLLGTFTYDVNKMIAQTFHVQKQLPRTFRYIKFQVESNWGNPEYTCVYRVQKAGSCMDLASPHSNHSMVQTGNLHHSSELFDAFWYFKFQVERDRGNPEYTCVYRVQEYRKRDESGLSEAELESLRKAQGWLEQMRQLKETEDQVSAAKRNILQAVTLALEEHGVQEEKREGVDEAGAETLLGTFTYDVNKMIAQTFHVQKQLPRTFRYIKFQVESNWGNPEYTCVYRVQKAGSCMDLASPHSNHSMVQTGNLHHSSELFDAFWYFKFQVERDRGNPEYTCVYRVQEYRKRDESGLSEAELESLRKAQGWLEQMRQLKETEDQVSAAKRNILQAVTLALEEHGVQEEKREGVDEAGAETLLGTFTYDVNKMIAQTFHVQKQLPRTFRYIKFQVESNWGNPEYTCVYRVQDESGLSEAELESLRKAQGWLEQMRQLKETEDQVSAAKRNILQAVTLALEEHGVQEEKREGVDEAGAETLLGTFTYDVNKMIAQTFHVQKQLPRTFRYIKFQVESNWGNPEYTCVYRVQDESGLSEAELESLRKAQGWLEQMRQLKETEDQVSAAKRNILQAVTLALEEHGVQEEKREGVDEAGAETLLGTFTYDVNKMIAQTFHVQKQLPRTFRYIKFQVESNWGNPEYTCVYRVQDESGLSEVELESLRKAQGWLEQMRQLKETEDQVSAAKRNILQAVTLALEEHGVQEEKREGVDEAGAETLLGTFTYDVNKMIAQTFHVQKQLPRTFRYIKFQVESNWGNPEYTCVYRVQKAGSCMDLASPHSNHSMVQTGNLHHSSELFDAFWYFKFQVERDRGNPEYTCVYRVQEYRKRDESGLSEAELESLRKAQGWLEQMRQLKETEDQVSAAKRNILQAVTLALEEHGVQEEKREGVDEAGAETLLGTFTYDVNKMIAQTFHVQKQLPRTFRYIKFQVESNWGNPEYTCVYRVQKAGSCMDLASPHSNHSMVQTGNLHHSSELFDAFWYFKFQVERDRGNPEYTCVYRVQEYRKRDESGLSEAELESLRKAQGWLEQMRQLKETEDQVSAAKRNILQAVTLALEEHGVQEEKREGVDEAGAETLLGTFTYDVNKMIAQTFHVQKQLPRTFRYIKFQVESNWGNPEYTCVYRVQDESGLSEAELESLRKAQGWLEQMRQLKETKDQVSAAKRNILQAVTLTLDEHGVQEEKREVHLCSHRHNERQEAEGQRINSI
ncbi:hypothetical protein Q9233_012987 [Columba guinea]|nr:hypothetical protein Q9233_012987 [Columba guinea]